MALVLAAALSGCGTRPRAEVPVTEDQPTVPPGIKPLTQEQEEQVAE